MQSTTLPSKKKRLLILAGIFVLPAVAIIVALVSVLHPKKKALPAPPTGSAFNAALPQPNLPKHELNKLELYMQAQEDSVKQNAERAKDPYAKLSLTDSTRNTRSSLPNTPHAPTAGVVTSPFADDNDKKVNDRMQKLYGLIGNTPPPEKSKFSSTPSTEYGPATASPQVERLQRLMQEYQKRDTETNPQLTQVKQILDQIKDIQHPTTAATGILPSGPDRTLPVSATPPALKETSDSLNQENEQNGFFGLSDAVDTSSSTYVPAIEAVIHGDQTVQSGSIVKLRLVQPMYVAGVKIPANAFIYGPAAISGERVTIQLTNAIYDGHIYPIAMQVYDGGDGLDGLYVPGMITRDVVKQNMSQGVSGINIGSLDPSLSAQAASAAIETARNLMSRKIAIIKATLKSGHLAILKSTSGTH